MNEQPQVALGEPWRPLELRVPFITAHFAPPLIAQPRPLSASQTHVWVWQQRASSQSCLLQAHTWDSAPSPCHHLGTLAFPQLPYLKCTASTCASPSGECSAWKAGILLTSIPSDSWDQEGLKIIPSVTRAVLTCTLAAQRRLPGSVGTTNTLGEALLTLPAATDPLRESEQPVRASSKRSCTASQKAHPKELFPWPTLHTRHIRNDSNTCPRAVLSPVFPASGEGTLCISSQQNMYVRVFPTCFCLSPCAASFYRPSPARVPALGSIYTQLQDAQSADLWGSQGYPCTHTLLPHQVLPPTDISSTNT